MQATVYSKDSCPFCDRAINLLRENGVDSSVIKVGTDISKEAFKEEVHSLSGLIPETVPQIILDGQYIGGCDDLIAYYERQQMADDFSDIEL